MSRMHLRLALPPRADTPDPEVVTRPAEQERWIARLPMLDVARSTTRVTRQLAGLNRMALDDRTRLRLLEALRGPVQHLERELARGYAGLPRPLPERAGALAARLRELLTEMAGGYKLIAVNSTVTPVEQLDRDSLAVALHRAIRYLTALRFRGYELYRPPSEGAWLELHRLYRYAERLGLAETPIADPLNDTLRRVSVGHAYKHALLLDFADPYHLPARMLARIDRYLDRYAALATLAPGAPALHSQCRFLVDLDQDRAGVIHAEPAADAAGDSYRLLLTKELARVIHRQLKALQSGRPPQADGLGPEFFAHQGTELLARLIQAWGVNPRRTFARRLRENRRLEVAFGIDAIRLASNRGQPFRPSTLEVGPPPRHLAPAAAAGRAPPALASTVWALVDESAGGYALAGDGDSARVGDLLAARADPAQDHWEIGVVRWVRIADGRGGVEIGVQRLSPVAAPAAIRDETGGGPDAPALVLAEVTAMRQPATLIAPGGTFNPERVLVLDNGYRTRRIRPLRLSEYASAFERFEFETLD